MQYIIMCGGRLNDRGEPKQLQIVKDEPIIARTIRLLRENGISDIAISSIYPDFDCFGVPVLKHRNTFVYGGRWLEAFYPTKKPVCYLCGDVVYSPEAIKTIIETPTDSIEYFATAPPFSDKYIKTWAEPLAYKVADVKLFKACIEVTKYYADIGRFRREPIAWELWQVIKGTPLNQIDYTNYTVINDYSCDVDCQEQLEKIGEYIE